MRINYCAALLALALPLAHGNDLPDEITLGLIATNSASETISDWTPLVGDLEKKLGVKVKPVAYTNYGEIVDGLKANHIQLAWLSNKIAIDAVVVGKSEVIAQTLSASGQPTYSSVIITRKDSGINSIEQVLQSPGKYSYGSGNYKSTSGYLVPGYYLFSKNDINIRTHFKTISFGSHQENFLKVANKQVDLAVNNSDDMDDFKSKYGFEHSQVKVLWTSEGIPFDPILVRKDLPAAGKAKILDFLTHYGRTAEEQKNLFAAARLKGFRKSSNRQLKPIADLQMFFEKQTLMNDETMTAESKTEKFEAIDRKFTSIQKMLGGG